MLEDHAEALVHALQQKKISLRILCGSEDEDCLPMARQLYAAAEQAGIDGKFTVQENSRHQFPARLYRSHDLW